MYIQYLALLTVHCIALCSHVALSPFLLTDQCIFSYFRALALTKVSNSVCISFINSVSSSVFRTSCLLLCFQRFVSFSVPCQNLCVHFISYFSLILSLNLCVFPHSLYCFLFATVFTLSIFLFFTPFLHF